jgi:hypothetical protein
LSSHHNLPAATWSTVVSQFLAIQTERQGEKKEASGLKEQAIGWQPGLMVLSPIGACIHQRHSTWKCVGMPVEVEILILCLGQFYVNRLQIASTVIL